MNRLPKVTLKGTATLNRRADRTSVRVSLENPSRALAFFVRLKLTRGREGDEMLPILWQENYINGVAGRKAGIDGGASAGLRGPGDAVRGDRGLEHGPGSLAGRKEIAMKMHAGLFHPSAVVMAAAAVCLALISTLPAQEWNILDVGKLELVNCKAEVVDFRGQKALQLTQPPGSPQNAMAMLKGVEFRNGTIEVEVAGEPGAGAVQGARGFIGIAFRLANPQTYENVYLRPTNGRAEDQVRRNHSVQYESMPDFPWSRLRKEFPEKYESYVDLEPGVWTRYRLVVEGARARLFVHGAAQPVLLVDDLKLGETAKGGVALWIGPGTLGHFRNLKITP